MCILFAHNSQIYFFNFFRFFDLVSFYLKPLKSVGVNFQQSYRPWLMGENDFRSISCEIIDRFRSNFGSLLLVLLSIRQQFTVGVLWAQLLLHFFGQSFWNSSCSFRPIVLKLHRWLGHLLKMCKLCLPNILWKNWWIWIIFCIHTNFPLKKWTQRLSDTHYQLPILLLKYHIPDRDIPNFLLCPFLLRLPRAWRYIGIRFSIRLSVCPSICPSVNICNHPSIEPAV